MNAKQIAIIATARLGLPVPTGKLFLLHSLAHALKHPQTEAVYADAIVEWLASRELESECLEGLAIFLLAPPATELLARVQGAIKWPSLASAALLSIISSGSTGLQDWTQAHSGRATLNEDLSKAEEALASCTFIPPVFLHEVQALESGSGYPFVRQWAFEYSAISKRVSNTSDGHFSYFLNGQHDHVGQFVGRQGHLARSAFLRVLAFAVEKWDMPEETAYHYAQTAFPAEPLFLKFLPGSDPAWLGSAPLTAEGGTESAEQLVVDSIDRVENAINGRVMHLSMNVVDGPERQVELEVFTVFAGEAVNAEQVLRIYTGMLGRLTLARDDMRAFVSPVLPAFFVEKFNYAPALLPLIGPCVGYLQNDFVSRTPYIPFSSASLPAIELRPGEGGGALTSSGQVVGHFAFWHRKWQPTHKRNWPSPTGCCTYLTRDAAERQATDHAGKALYVWKLTTWTRKTEYEEWEESVLFGSGPVLERPGA
ncbi:MULTISPECIES: hypothetical protein [unclassified Pseudomonas]|uniref:hypothetical protein n=1 Tax=unclassified Pseudomonas TaxID=196821 RepID=UPI001AE523E3|nr:MULTISPECIES: hypothetical protein [unclassified Pseudomonas]MBP2271462.1 hypothetical protein [Pseudomonas sp. BP6]MBP2289567.1 hypothetical protein [Pseudomonas sp. BP7]HDS1695118.1 hypothetical protein [Pseudomonas putida]HDS1700288.1 hypothetical protein [Pseudomonas putida]